MELSAIVSFKKDRRANNIGYLGTGWEGINGILHMIWQVVSVKSSFERRIY